MNYSKPVTITLDGNGHTIRMAARTHIHVANNATLNLGGEGCGTLTIIGTKYIEEPGLVTTQSASATVNMYDGVTLKDNQTNNYFGGGVTMKRGTFNMYGGMIENCGVKGGSVCFGGGVGMSNGALFNMYGGTIKDCYAETSLPSRNKGLIPWGAGGGVFVGGGSEFNMKGGTITGCSTTESGGGVFIVASVDSYHKHSSFGFVDSSFNMSGGEITDCTADYYGGAVAVDGYYVNANVIATATPAAGAPADPGVRLTGGTIQGNEAGIGGGMFVICIDPSIDVIVKDVELNNNAADAEGADLYLSDVTASVFDAAKMTAKYLGKPDEATGYPIDGWYEDYSDSRYADQTAAQRVPVSSGTITADDAGDIALIAALDPVFYTVTFDLQKHGSPKPDDQVIFAGYTAEEPDAPTDAEMIFGGWFTDAACTKAFDFATPITADITLYALWTMPPAPTYTFTFTKQWDDDLKQHPTPGFVLYNPDGSVCFGADKAPEAGRNGAYTYTVTEDAAYYVKEAPMNGYVTTYRNVGKYAGVTDRAYAGGTIVNKKVDVPKTGDDMPILWYAAAMLLSLAVLGIVAVGRKRGK